MMNLKKTSTIIGSIALLSTIGVAGLVTTQWQASVRADDLPKPYVNVQLKKVMDGTGWDDHRSTDKSKWTPKPGAHTFIQTSN